MSTKTPLLTWRRLFLGAVVIVVVLCAAAYWRGVVGTTSHHVNGQEKGEGEALGTQEAATLRKIVETKGLVTSHQVSTAGVADTELVVPSDFENLYKAKRLPALRLLLDIVRTGSAHDALSAAAFATAMEEGPIRAAFCAHQSRDDFDEDSVGLGSTPRSRLDIWLEKIINSGKEANEEKDRR
jgi:hypothetical protein